MKAYMSAAVGLAMLSVASVGQAATVDFGGFAEGTVLGMNTDLGNGIIADVSAVSGTNQAIILSTIAGSVGTGNDPDLTSDFSDAEGNLADRGFGNAVIVQEDQSGKNNPTTGPDDNASGGTLTFDFLKNISLTSVYLLDAAENTIATLLLDGNIVSSFTLDSSNESDTGNNANNNEFTFLDFGGATGNALVIEFADSGAIGEFEASVVPVPASLPLLIGGFGLLAFMRQRRKS